MSSAATRGRRFRPSEIPGLRESPFEPDSLDSERAAWVMGLWHDQDDRLRQRDRQVEENVRMLLGQHWIVWSELAGKYLDMSEFLDDDEKRWRHMPVLNRLFLWFILTHARMTENPPVITWQPGADKLDAELAETMDPIFKYLWREVGMLDVIDRLVGWLLPSGRAHLKSRIDFTLGDPIEARGPATLDLLGGDGSPILGPDGMPIRRQLDGVPLGADGAPQGQLTEDGFQGGDPHIFHEGMIDVDVLTCLEVRGEPGSHIPWHRSSYHIHRTLLSPEQAFDEFGEEFAPDIRGADGESESIFTRLVHGGGLFGSAGRNTGQRVEVDANNREFVSIYELWHRPSRIPGTERRPGQPGGRLLIVTGSGQVIRDGQRFAPFKYTSPIRCFDYTRLPGRPGGTSPQEMLNGPIRTRNRLTAQELGHATLVANPVRVVDQGSGIKAGQIRNVPGEEILVPEIRQGVDPFRYVAAPPMGREVSEAGMRLTREIDQMASLSGAEGSAPTADASGELVKELRFNADRPIAAPMRMMVVELARMAEDWRVMIPIFWDKERTLRIVGEDFVPRTLTVYPHLFEEGTVNAEPEIESMLPEGRGERQQRVERMWQAGVWGPPDSPGAINTFLELARFPHMSQTARPGGHDRSMAAQNVGKLLSGATADPASIPIFEWYDHGLHRHTLEQFMKSPEFLKVSPAVQEQMVIYRQRLLEAEYMKAMMDMGRMLQAESEVQGAMGGGVGGPRGPSIAGSENLSDPTAPAEGRPKSRREATSPMEAVR